MKKLFLVIIMFFVPLTALATTSVPWSITNLTDGFIFPNLINGSHEGILVSASSTINGAFSVSSLTSGNCVQASTGGLLTSTSGACASGTPGGASSTIQYNKNGAFGGLASFTTDGTNITQNGNLTVVGTSTLGTTTTSVLNGIIVVNGKNYPQTSAGINQAVAQCGQNGIGNVYLPQGVFTMNSRVTPVNNCHVYGAGKGVTILQGGNNSDWDFYYSSNTAPLLNFVISDLTVDLQNTANAAGIQFSNSSSSEVDRVTFTNGAAGGWFLVIGPESSSNTAVVNSNDKFIDDDFSNHKGTLEAFLVSNAQNTQIERPILYNISSPGIGLWQQDYDTHINNFFCSNSSNGQIYYNISTERTTIDSPNFNNCGAAIVGAGTSDNGNFGLSQAQDLKIINPIIIGGSNSLAVNALEIGAVNNAMVINPTIAGYGAAGIAIDGGDENASSSPTNWSIIGGTIKNNNQSNIAAAIHPGIIFGTSTPSGLDERGLIQGVQIYDDQASPTQKFPITFDSENGAIQYNGVRIIENQLNAPVSLGGTSITLPNSTTLGILMQIYGNANYTGTNPSQTFSVYNGFLGVGATSTPGSIFSINNIANFTTGTTSIYSTNSLNLPSGACFAVNGVCIPSTATSNYWTLLGNDISNNNTGRVGIGSSTPDSGASFDNFSGISVVHVSDPATNDSRTKLLVDNRWSGTGGYGFIVERNATTPQFVVDGTSNVGVGTSTPYALLSIGNTGGIGFTLATSTFNTSGGININAGCFAISGNCLSLSNIGGQVNLGTQVTGTLPYINGGTGTTTASLGQLLYGGATAYQSVATSSANCTGGISCSAFTVVGNVSPSISISAPISVSNGGTGTTTQINNAVNFYNGTNITSSSTLLLNPSGILSIQATGASGDAINIGSGGLAISQTNGTAHVRSGFSGKFFIISNTSNANEAVFAYDTGFLSIATGAAPAYPLDVLGAGHFTGLVDASNFIATSTSVASNIVFKLGVGTSSPFAKLSIHANNGDTNQVLFAIGSSTATATTTLFVVNNIGNVGIGTSSPGATFTEVAASSTVASNGYFGAINIIAGLENTVVKLFQIIDQWGHLITSGDTPTVSGGTSTVAGNDRNGAITVVGTLLTSVTLTFAHAYAAAPDCTESDNSTAVTADINSISASQIVFGFSAGINTGTVWYVCQQHN